MIALRLWWCMCVTAVLAGKDGASGGVRAGGGKLMERMDVLVLQVLATPGEDEEELAGSGRRLRALLLELDVDDVRLLTEAGDVSGAKGLGTVLAGLVVRFGTAGGLRSVLAAVTSWATRTGHSVEVRYGDDRLVVTGVTPRSKNRSSMTCP